MFGAVVMCDASRTVFMDVVPKSFELHPMLSACWGSPRPLPQYHTRGNHNASYGSMNSRRCIISLTRFSLVVVDISRYENLFSKRSKFLLFTVSYRVYVSYYLYLSSFEFRKPYLL